MPVALYLFVPLYHRMPPRKIIHIDMDAFDASIE